jgi:hypothetical protein
MKIDWKHMEKMRFNGTIHPVVYRKAKRGSRDALLWIAEDLNELASVGGFLGGVYKRAARRVRNIERTV